jgi:hypothetical protein
MRRLLGEERRPLSGGSDTTLCGVESSVFEEPLGCAGARRVGGNVGVSDKLINRITVSYKL